MYETIIDHQISQKYVSRIRFLLTVNFVQKPQIRFRIDYGSLIWLNLPQYILKKIEVLQLYTLKIAMDYRKSIPINIILFEFREPRLIDRIKMLDLNYMFRVLSYSEHRLLDIFNDISIHIKCPTDTTKIHPLFLFECFTTANQFLSSYLQI